MIRRFGFILGFFLGFSLEVTVEAAEPVQLRSINVEKNRANQVSSALVEEPKLCLTTEPSTGTCALRVGPRRRLVHEPSAGRVWTMSELTMIVRLGEDHLRLLGGSLKVEGSKPSAIETEHGTLVVSDQAFVDRVGGKLTVVNTGATPLEFRGRGWREAQIIPSGLEVFVDLPDVRSGETAVSLPLPLNFDAQVVREARLFEGSKESFGQRLEALAALRSSAAQLSADLHQRSVERQIAAVQERQRKNRSQQAAREAKDKELRALFRRKVLNPQ